YQQASWLNQNLTGLGSQMGGTGTGSGNATVPAGNWGSSIFGGATALAGLASNPGVSSALGGLFGGAGAGAGALGSSAGAGALAISDMTAGAALAPLALLAARGGRINKYAAGGGLPAGM